MSDPIYCPIRQHWCRCGDYGKRCEEWDEPERPAYSTEEFEELVRQMQESMK